MARNVRRSPRSPPRVARGAHDGATFDRLPGSEAVRPSESQSSTRRVPLSTMFIRNQRRHLLGLRTQLRSAAEADERDERDLNQASHEQAREYEDDAQNLTLLELVGRRVFRGLARLARVDRALQKLKQGTYGLSDVSGRPIPQRRLQVVPEATCTIEEEQAFSHRTHSVESSGHPSDAAQTAGIDRHDE